MPPELQRLKQQSLELDRDLLILQDKLKQPLRIFVSQYTDSKFVLEKMTIKLNGRQIVSHEYNEVQRQALTDRGAHLIYQGALQPGVYNLIAYYQSGMNYQGGSEFKFTKSNEAYDIEVILHKNESRESRLQPEVSIRRASAK